MYKARGEEGGGNGKYGKRKRNLKCVRQVRKSARELERMGSQWDHVYYYVNIFFITILTF